MEWYADYIVAEGRAGVTWILIAFVATFLITRGITRKIRREQRARELAVAEGRLSAEEAAPDGLIKDIHIGGVHIHHQVWGLLLLLTMGILQFAYEFGSPWIEVTGALFGVGAALVLDEFALFLHLDDVYWSAEGQKSVDAVVATVCVLVALVLGTGPLGIAPGEIDDAPLVVPVVIAINLALVVITLLKGKVMMAAIGIFIPIVTLVGAIRLARTPSWWSRNVYRRRPRRMARALAREHRHLARTERLRVSLGGEPDIDAPVPGAHAAESPAP